MTVEIRRAKTKADVAYASQRWCKYFGLAEGDDPPMEWLTNVFDDSDLCVFLADTGERRVGCGIAYITAFDWVDEEKIHSDLRSHYDETPTDVVYFPFATVDPAARGTGVYSALIDARIEYFDAAPAESILTTSWLRDDAPTSYSALSEAGFEELTRESYDDRVSCPDCGSECGCDSAVLRYDYT